MRGGGMSGGIPFFVFVIVFILFCCYHPLNGNLTRK